MSKKKFVGILGGTFDPPHEGHLFISNYAMKRLDLGEIWWIVTKKNPLKDGSSNFKKRLKIVKSFSLNRSIKIVEIHNEKKNIYTIDVLKYLFTKYPNRKFVWTMGVDNMKYFHLWKDWEKIFYNIPIAIFDRPSYSLNITKSKSLYFFRKARIKNNIFKKSKSIPTPCWTFVRGLKNNNSSSSIRKIR